jgi:predicted MFS family arabinose efflux permease
MPIYRTYKYRWVVLATYMYIVALSQLFWLNFTAIDTYIENNLGISAMSAGWLALVFPLVYLILSIPSGLIIDQKGFKFSIGLGAIFTGLFALLRIAGPQSYMILLISQLGIAVGQPFIINGITKLAITWFPKKEEATAIGLGSLAMFIGMIVGLGLTPVIVESLGFELMLIIYGVLGALGILLFFFFLKPQPPTPSRKSEEEKIMGWRAIIDIIKIKNFVILGFIALIGIGVFNGLATWLEKILNELHGISMVDAGTISAILIFSGMIGCIVIPVFSDKMNKRKPFLLMSSLIGAIGIIILIFQGSFAGNLYNGILIGFFLLSALPIMLTMSIEITGERFAGISVAYLQLLGNGAAVAIVPIMEILHGTYGTHVLPLSFLAMLLFIALILATQIAETGKASYFSNKVKTGKSTG